MGTIGRRAALRRLTATAIGAPAVLRGRFALFAQSSDQYSARAIQLVQQSTVVDLLNQFMFPHQVQQGVPLVKRWLREPGSFSALDAETFLASGINVFCLGLGTGRDRAVANGFFADWNSFIAAYPEYLRRIDDGSDFEKAKNERKIGIALTLQDSLHFQEPEDVDHFYGLGLRIAQLTYNYGNLFGSGVLENRDAGLTVYGEQILRRMEAVGMGVDLSHCGDQTTLDALDAARRPILFTHTSCRALVPGHVRAKTDEMIRKMAATGGLIGIAFIRFYVRDREPVSIGHVIDHIDHVRKLVGVEYVAIGSDVDITGWAAAKPLVRRQLPESGPSQATPNFERLREHRDPENPQAGIAVLDHPKRTYDLAQALIERGYSDNEIRLILGGNAVRVLGRIWSRT